MGLLEPRLSFALVVFVLSPDGELDTIGGEPVSARELGMVHGGASAGDVGAALLRGTPWEPVRGVTTARLRPLMPRVSRRGEVVVPMWTSGRFPAGGVWDLSSRFGGPLHGRALERLAESLGDPSLVAEAQVEFRRALASDPLSHQMVGEGVRLRGLALDGLEEIRAQEIRAQELSARGMGGFAPSDGRPPLPPLLALLPAEFTIEQLRVAVRRVARIDEEELESASNFRRRIAEFVEARVLVEVGDVEDAKQKGRPAKLYRFDAESWSGWLRAKVRHLSARELFEVRRQRVVGELRVARALDSHGSDSPDSGAGASRLDDAGRSGAPAGAPSPVSPAMPLEFRDALPRRASTPDEEPRGGLGDAGQGASPMRSAGGEASRRFMRAPRSPSDAARGVSFEPEAPGLIVPSATPEATLVDDDRVSRLEAMVRHLALKFEQLSRGGGVGGRPDVGSSEGGADGAAFNPPTAAPGRAGR
jgi:hypothetical protein